MNTPINPPDSKHICIVGGSGFVGKHLSQQLISAGWQVKTLCRTAASAKKLAAALPGVTTSVGNVYDERFLQQEFRGYDAVVNLVGILNQSERAGQSFQAAHIDLPKRIGAASREVKVPRLLHMSSLKADSALGVSHYLLSKGEGESAVKVNTGGKVGLTIFRPSVIFGPQDGFTNRFASLLRFSPFVFPLACPQAQFAPVYIGDVCQAFITALDKPETVGQRYELCGPKVYSLREVVQLLAKVMRKRRAIIGLPDWLAILQAKFLQRVPGKPFTVDNYKSLQTPSVCSTNGLQQLGITATSMDALLPSYLGPKARKGQAN